MAAPESTTNNPLNPNESGKKPSEEHLVFLIEWLEKKGVSSKVAQSASSVISAFYINHPLSEFGENIPGLVGFAAKDMEHGGFYLRLYHLWPIKGNDATTDEMEEMNALTIPFSGEVSRTLRPNLSVHPNFLGFDNPATSLPDTFDNLFKSYCKNGKMDYIGVKQFKTQITL